MNHKRVVFILIFIITCVGLTNGIFKTKLFAKQLNNKNEFIPIDTYPITQGISDADLDMLQFNKYLILYDQEDEGSIVAKNNIVRTMEYIKRPYNAIEIKDFKGLNERTSAIVVTFEDLNKLDRMDEIINYATEGGSVLFAQRMYGDDNYNQYKDILGIKSVKGEKAQAGIELTENLLIRGKGFKTSSAVVMNSSFEITLKDECKVYAKTYEGIPLIWEVAYGNGKIVAHNGSMLGEESNRGIIVGLLSMLEPNFIYPIHNVKAVFLDDFPAPIPEKNIGSVFQGVEMSISQFYRMIWWPNMLKLANKNHIKYSGVIIESYSDQVKGPFDIADSISEESLFFFGKEIINHGGELGIHGYNHQSLTYNQEDVEDEGYKAWENVQDVKESLLGVKGFVGKLLPKYELRSYVPPSNILSAEVRKQFPSIIPEVKVICSLYKSQKDNEKSYVQEFEVASDGIVEFPRISAGYTADDASRWNIYNGVSLHGIVSHFIHPDDLFDPFRNKGRNWEEMYAEFGQLFDNLFEKYEWIRPMTISDAAEEVKKYEACDVYTLEANNILYGYLRNFRKDMYFVLRTSKVPMNAKQCTVEKIDEGIYLVYAQNPKFSIELKEGGK